MKWRGGAMRRICWEQHPGVEDETNGLTRCVFVVFKL